MSVFRFALPAEILDCIFAEVPQQDLPACCLVNRWFNNLCTPYLYRILSLNLFHVTRYNNTFVLPKNIQPEVPSPRDHVLSSLEKILAAETHRKEFILSSVRKIEVYGIDGYSEEHQWPVLYREMGQLYPLEVNIGNLLLQVLNFAYGLKEFLWDLDLIPSTALLMGLKEHSSITGILFTNVCLATQYEREYDLDLRDEDVPERYLEERAIRRRGRQPHPLLPFQDPIIDFTGFRNLVVLGVNHIGSWEQCRALNSVIKACIKTLRSLSLLPCGMSGVENIHEECKDNGNLLTMLLSMSGTGELLKLRTLELVGFELHKETGRYINFSVLESLMIDSYEVGRIKDFWHFWVNSEGSSPRNFPNLKRFRFIGGCPEEEAEPPLEGLVDLISRVPNGLQVLEFKYQEFRVTSARELEIWRTLLDDLRISSAKTLQTLVLFDDSICQHGRESTGIRGLLLKQLADYASEWQSLETLLIEPANGEWDNLLATISQLPKLTTIIMKDFSPPPRRPRTSRRMSTRTPTNRRGRKEPRAGVNVTYMAQNMINAEYIAEKVFLNASTTRYICIAVGYLAGRSFYRCSLEAGVVQICEEEFVAATGTRGLVRWVSPMVDYRALSDLFNKDLPAWGQSVEEMKAGVGVVVGHSNWRPEASTCCGSW